MNMSLIQKTYNGHDIWLLLETNGKLWLKADEIFTLAKFKSSDTVSFSSFDTTKEVRLSWPGRTKFIHESKIKLLPDVDLKNWLAENISQVKIPSRKFNTWLAERPQLANRGFVYVATTFRKEKKHIYKISKTKSLDAELSILNNSSPEDYMYVFTFKTEIYEKLCTHLHTLYIKKRTKRYNYTLTGGDLLELKDVCKLYRNNHKNLQDRIFTIDNSC